MDLETENRIASILLREAAELRRQAEKEGVRAYLEKPNVRHRPNPRFLTATVLAVQQANKAVETNEMWRLRSKEIEFDERRKRKSREESSSGQSEQNKDNRHGSYVKRCTSVDNESRQSRNERWRSEENNYEDQGFGDDEVQTFLQSRVKRGRGSVGARMDETFFPPLPSDTRDKKLVLRPERSRHETDSSSSSSSEEERGHRKRKEHKKKLSKTHKSKEKKRDKKKKRRREEKKRKHGRD